MEDREFQRVLSQNMRAMLAGELRDRESRLAFESQDRLVRLSYADWLDEHGQPGGEFLRVEVDLAALAPNAPEYHSTQYRLQSLRANLDTHWLAMVGYRYDVHVLGFPVNLLQPATQYLSGRGTLTYAASMMRLSRVPSILVFGTPREEAERIIRELIQLGAREGVTGAVRLKIAVAGTIDPGG